MNTIQSFWCVYASLDTMPEHIVRNMAAAVLSTLLWIKQLEISKQNLIEANITSFKKKWMQLKNHDAFLALKPGPSKYNKID